MLTEWQDSYAVGINLFDEQHKKLFKMLGTLFDGMKAKKKKEAMSAVLDELLLYTVTHFTAEEQVMLRHGYPGYEAHKKEHDALTSKVKTFHTNFNAGTALLTSELIGFLVNWLKNHIAETDQKYAPFMKEKGEG